MKAAICYESDKPLVVEEVDIDPPQKGEIKARLSATAICHSDIHLMSKEFGGRAPVLTGHESAGYVEEVGEGVTAVKPGDRVVLSLLASCRECVHCWAGQPHLCEAQWPLMTEARVHNKQGVAIPHPLKIGGFAEYTVVDQSQAVKIPDEMPLDRACLLSCGFITGFGAVVNRAKVETYKSVVIVGVGGVGISAVQGAVFSGAHPIIAVDVSDAKLETARSFGATHAVNAASPDAVEEIKKLTKGGADYVFITVGSASAMQQGMTMMGVGGTTVIIGLAPPSVKLEFSPFEFFHAEKGVIGNYMGATNLKVDVPNLVDLYLAGRLKLDEMITGRYPLEKINEAIASVERGEALRNVIMFE
jgi:Zn-dependent alcohol dehydrogenase